ncbi:EndoU domain-containing protein [Sneathiella marina]|uniref:EndoU domain-containing protein n=1 Tax=Sneathiella marina TaxID=2950108 RepID=A0ABY4VYL5_9PROT|nr:EndoU domain-containing protein [Sneathiella marina]USG59782.1 EndoU domain-containing protein [Sneathiella marina]
MALPSQPKKSLGFLLLLVGLFCLVVFWALFDASAPATSRSIWSSTDPAINVTHIFEGEINRRGKPVGFHVPPPEKGYPRSRIKEVLSGPNRSGVTTAIVEIFDTQENKWKDKFSSLFPKRLSGQEIISAILKAASRSELGQGAKWRGKSGYGFYIEGYRYEDGAINTAYPLYVAD